MRRLILFPSQFYLSTVMCLSIRTPQTINFPFVANVKFVILSVSKFGHITVKLLCAQILGH